mmetsp:Transcript_19607/g.28853  ORF Transcript_19607/g.28853 Transcript_19607/m.28853 type:complete len:114 (+) Transcript_19607:3-344(+)
MNNRSNQSITTTCIHPINQSITHSLASHSSKCVGIPLRNLEVIAKRLKKIIHSKVSSIYPILHTCTSPYYSISYHAIHPSFVTASADISHAKPAAFTKSTISPPASLQCAGMS